MHWICRNFLSPPTILSHISQFQIQPKNLPCEIFSGQPNHWEHWPSSFDRAWWRTLFARLNIQFQWHLNENPLLSIHNVLTIFICDCPILWQCHSRSGLKNGGIHYFHLHPAGLWVGCDNRLYFDRFSFPSKLQLEVLLFPTTHDNGWDSYLVSSHLTSKLKLQKLTWKPS